MEIKRMPNIVLTLDEFFDMEEKEFASGGEAVIFRTENPNTLYKFFKDRNGNYIDMSDNKLKKILELYKLNLSSAVRPLSTISVNGHLVGYEMTYNKDSVTLKNSGFSREQKIDILKRTKEILEYFKVHDITYGDVKSNNILVDRKTGKIEFCDMDNIRIRDYPMDLVAEYVQPFVKCGKIELCDAYIHNLMTLQQLGFPNNYPTFKEVHRELAREIYPPNFKEEAITIFESMAIPRKFNGEYVIQYVKK